MMNRKVRVIGDPLLRRRAVAVTQFDHQLQKLATDMMETMINSDGIGLAAPQVGVSTRLIVTGVRDEDERLILKAYANPVIQATSGEVEFEEGCLSIPGIRENVIRPERITLSWQDLEGNSFKEDLDDLSARVIQHEVDHLDGVLFVDRITPAKRILLQGRLKKLAREGG